MNALTRAAHLKLLDLILSFDVELDDKEVSESGTRLSRPFHKILKKEMSIV